MYVYQSGSYTGKAVAEIVFSKNFLQAKQRLEFLNSFLVNSRTKKKNREHEQLARAIALAGKIKPTMLCPICGKRKVTLVALQDFDNFFSLPGGKVYLSCSDDYCKRHSMYYASYGHGDAIFRSCSFKVFEARTRGKKKLIDPEIAWEILEKAYEFNKIDFVEFLQKNNYQ